MTDREEKRFRSACSIHRDHSSEVMNTNTAELVKYLTETFNTSDRPRVLTSGGIYIWDAQEVRILAGPFDSMQQACDAKSKALDKAIKKVQQ